MTIQTATAHNPMLYMDDVSVSQNGMTITIDGFALTRHRIVTTIEASTFDLEPDATSDVIYDVYIVEQNGVLDLQLERTVMSDGFATYTGTSGTLIHTLLTIQVLSDGTVNGQFNKVLYAEPQTRDDGRDEHAKIKTGPAPA